jgi:3-oxoacyl-[acyl-carrier protein] reductase
MGTNNKVVVITGAGSGMGRATAVLFAEKGYEVIGTDINNESLDETVSMINEANGKASGITADLRKVDDIKNIKEQIEDRTGKIDVLINCAGVLGGVKELTDFSEEEMDLIIDVNLKAVYRCCKYLLPLIVKNKNGMIINISSQSGKMGQAGVTIYCAAKWGVIGFTKALELEAKKDGIRVVVINPGSTNTNFYGKDARFEKDFLKKFLKPEDIARACLFVAEQPDNSIIYELNITNVSESFEVVIK